MSHSCNCEYCLDESIDLMAVAGLVAIGSVLAELTQMPPACEACNDTGRVGWTEGEVLKVRSCRACQPDGREYIIATRVKFDQSFADHSAQSVQAIAEASGLNWHYGPTAADPEPGKMWHYGCGQEVLIIDDGLICGCGAQDDPADPFSGIPNADDLQNARI